MRAAFNRVDVVGVGVDGFVVAVVVLHGDFRFKIGFDGLEVDDVMEGVLIGVQMGDELLQTAEIVVDLFARHIRPHVAQGDADAGVQEGEFAEAVLQDVPFVFRDGEDFRIRLEFDGRSCFGRLADLLQRAGRVAAGEFHLMFIAVAVDCEDEPFGEGVDAGDADAVEAAGDFVCGMVEFTAGVQNGEGDFAGGLLFDGMDIDRDAAAVVRHGDGIVDVDDDFDVVAVAGERFVDGVVHDFIDKMVETTLMCVANIHGRAFADGFQTFQNGDLGGVVFGGIWRRRLWLLRLLCGLWRFVCRLRLWLLRRCFVDVFVFVW